MPVHVTCPLCQGKIEVTEDLLVRCLEELKPQLGDITVSEMVRLWELRNKVKRLLE